MPRAAAAGWNRWRPCKMEATPGLVYTAQQMAAGAVDSAVVKVSPGAQGRSAEMTQPEARGRGAALVLGGRQKGRRGGLLMGEDRSLVP